MLFYAEFIAYFFDIIYNGKEVIMKLFLCSNFKYLAAKFLPRFFDLSKKHNCLLIGYADDWGDFYSESNTLLLESLNFNVFHLDENYKFEDKIDMIFVKGGNTTQLIDYLKQYNQFEKIKEMVNGGVVFAGQSAGAIVAGSETEWTLESEPYDVDIKKKYGKEALKGFGFINKLIFVHASRFRFPFNEEIKNAGRMDFKVKNDFFYKAYLRERRQNKGKPFIVLKDNEAFLKDGKKEQIVKFDWSSYPVLEIL